MQMAYDRKIIRTSVHFIRCSSYFIRCSGSSTSVITLQLERIQLLKDLFNNVAYNCLIIPNILGQETSVVQYMQSTQHLVFNLTFGTIDDRKSSRESKIENVKRYVSRIAWKSCW